MEPARFDAMIDLLRNWPANGKPENSFALVDLVAHGLVESREQKEPCKTCGTARVAFRYMKITPAGRMVLALANRESDNG